MTKLWVFLLKIYINFLNFFLYFKENFWIERQDIISKLLSIVSNLKGIAIGLSNNAKEILKRLKKTEFVKDIYIAGSSKEDGKENELIQVQKPREILLKKWPKIDLIIFIGSIAASIRIINSFLTSKDQDPGCLLYTSDAADE